MYFLFVLLTMIVLPVLSILWEGSGHWVMSGHQLAVLTPIALKWFVFWGVGVRLGVAGVRQWLRPAFTAREIFKIDAVEVLPIVKELGISNFAAGVVGLMVLVQPGFAPAIALWSAIFYAGAGFVHAGEKHRGPRENFAMLTDFFMFAVLMALFAATSLGKLSP